MSVADARKKVKAWRGLAAAGLDPVKPKPKKLTFGELATEYVDSYCKKNQRTWPQTERILKVNCEPLWNRPVEAIGKDQIKKLTAPLRTKAIPTKARTPMAS
jgi:hypothetical protein